MPVVRSPELSKPDSPAQLSESRLLGGSDPQAVIPGTTNEVQVSLGEDDDSLPLNSSNSTGDGDALFNVVLCARRMDTLSKIDTGSSREPDPGGSTATGVHWTQQPDTLADEEEAADASSSEEDSEEEVGRTLSHLVSTDPAPPILFDASLVAKLDKISDSLGSPRRNRTCPAPRNKPVRVEAASNPPAPPSPPEAPPASDVPPAPQPPRGSPGL